MAYKFAGASLIAFGIIELVFECTFGFFVESLPINVLAFFVIGLGSSVWNRRSRSVYWSLALMGLYLAPLITLVVAGFARPDLFRIGHRPIQAAHYPYMLGFVIGALSWVVINMILLIRLLLSSRTKAN
jgi:hypothetical protein